jgi:hypothetical protein
VAEGTFEGCDVELRPLLLPARCGRHEGHRRLTLFERQTERLGELHWVAMPLDVHVHRRGLGAQQVVVDCGHLDPALDEARHDRVHLLLS